MYDYLSIVYLTKNSSETQEVYEGIFKRIFQLIYYAVDLGKLLKNYTLCVKNLSEEMQGVLKSDKYFNSSDLGECDSSC